MGASIHHPPAVFFASVNSINVSPIFNQFLIKIVVVSGGGGQADTADLTFDDSGGQLQMPRANAEIVCGLGWMDTGPQAVFTGFVEALQSFGSREGGRLLTIHAVSNSPIGLSKKTFDVHLDGGNFGDAAKHFGQMAGLNVQVDPRLSQVQRDYWSMGKQSFLQWGESMARKLGGSFIIAGDTAQFTSRDASATPSGVQYPTIVCEAGANLIRWELTPVYLRPQFGKFTTEWYDLQKAQHNYETLDGGIANVEAELINRYKIFNQDQAKQRNLSNKAENDHWGAGGGTIVIIGEPNAGFNGTATVVGAREGIDGDYRIETATHILSRTQSPGYITELTVVEPGVGGASQPTPDPPFIEQGTPGQTQSTGTPGQTSPSTPSSSSSGTPSTSAPSTP